MKKLLYILLAINIISLILAFFMILGTSMIYAIIFGLLGVLQLIPLIAIISNMDNIENMQDDLSYLYNKVRQFEDANKNETDVSTPPATNYKDTAIAPWKCVKCDTINKANTNHCSNCKAPYSPFINPTDNPYAKKKISRWVKYK